MTPVAEREPWGQTFEEAVGYLRQKTNLPTRTWRDIDGRANDRSFIVAGAMKTELLQDLRAAIEKAVAGQMTLVEFRKEFESIVAARGWTGWTGEGSEGGRAWRTRVIYETNLKTAYAAGRYAQMTDPDVVKVQKWWRYRHAFYRIPERARPDHESWDGLVLAWNDPWFDTHYPPNGWNCSCGVETLSDEDLADEELTPGQAPPIVTRDVIDPATGQTVKVPLGIDFGWDHAPGRDWSRGLVPREAQRPLEPPGTQGPPVRPPPMPTPRPFTVQRLPPDADPDKAVDDFLGTFGATRDVPAIVRDAAGHALPVGIDLFRAGDGLSKAGKRGRHRDLPALAETLKAPDEIWLDWVQRRDSARWMLVRRYLRAAPDDAGFAAFSWSDEGWQGATAFTPRSGTADRPNLDYLATQRRGALLWRRPVDDEE